ncbi:hypothetical protein ACFPK1_16215 [Actinomycetospora rhizophila]|uniref:Uncharacterized protein n=1 Tax=Actinomycetospora rhizophila TaxID=1416876 RepID=A0ABV9ZGN2_9PSEU
MKELSDRSLRDLKVEAPDVTVYLSDRRAEAVGTEEMTSFVQNAWARSRQVKDYPVNYGWHEKFPAVSGAVVFTVSGFGLTGYLASTVPDPPTFRYLGTLVVIFACLMLLAYLSYSTNKRQYDALTWAVTQPLTNQEIRDLRDRTTRVPLWSLVVAILAFLVTSFFLILNYLTPGP